MAAALYSEYELEGTILRRRCLGRFLAFADVLSHDENKCWSITFRKEVLETNNFPIKKAALPFGGKFRAVLVRAHDGGWDVKSWELTSNPQCEAIENARLDGGGISLLKRPLQLY
jgi:hypothetical protein